MTQQEIFDKVWHAMRKQNEKSTGYLDRRERCRYRGPNGLKCAAGHLIEDKDYSKTMEGHTFGNSVHWPKELMHHRVLVVKLQNAHDDANPNNFWDSFREEAKAVAKEFGLTIPEEK